MGYRVTARFGLPFAVVALAIVACTPGTVINAPASSGSSTQAATAPPIPSSAPFTTTTSSPLPTVTAPPAGQTPQPVQVAVPSSQGYSGTFALPISGVNSIAANTTVIVTLSNQTPAGAPTTLARRRATAPRAAPMAAAPSSLVPLLFLQMWFSGGISLANQPTITFAVPSADIVAGASYWIAMYDSTRPDLGWQLGFEGPGTVTGTSIAFVGGGGSFNFVPFSSYYFALYAQSTAAATPTPAPTPTPTPVPTATPSPGATPTPIPSPQFGVMPGSIGLYAIGATATISATGTAPYFAFPNNYNVATVSPANGNSPFTVTAVAAGTAQITIVDSTGLQAIVPVTVTTTTIPVQ